MAVQGPIAIPFPLSSFPGTNPQESLGRLVNCYADPLGESGQGYRWVRSAGLSLQVSTTHSGYRGGLVVDALSYECWNNTASTVDASGNLSDIGNFPGSEKVSIARNQGAPDPDVVAVDPSTGAYVLGSAPVAAATAIATIGGTVFTAGDVLAIVVLNPYLSPPFPISVSHTVVANESASTIAVALAAAINANSDLAAANVTAATGTRTTNVAGAAAGGAGVVRLQVASTTGMQTNDLVSVSGVVGTVEANGSHKITVIDGTHIDLQGTVFANAYVSGGVVTDPTADITVSQQGAIGNSSSLLGAVTGGTETITTTPASGNLSGGTGTVGAFTGLPTLYTGQGTFPTDKPSSICFQDGYFFFTFPNGTVRATGINSLSMNALTYITVQAKADVTLLRGVPFSGLLFLFTTGSCEVWQDAALTAPNFPYSRMTTLEVGLIQGSAIAGWETGFSELLWVAQDFGVYWRTSGSLSQIKASPPDLDRLIEAAVRAGQTLEAGCYIAAGKKFWTISCDDWTWEFNLSTKKWTERESLTSLGTYSRWRGDGGHPAFGKWLLGDVQTGSLFFTDDTNATEFGTPMLYRIESGPVSKFPMQQRIARADFDFVVGVGQAVGSIKTVVKGAAASGAGSVLLEVFETAGMATNDVAKVSGVTGTTEANGNWPITVVDATHIELQGSVFAHAYGGGGTVVDLTSPSNEQSPNVAISMTKDGGNNWGNPLLRPLGKQAQSQRARVSVTNMGLSGPMGVRWRLDITDPVYASFKAATMASDIRMVGT